MTIKFLLLLALLFGLVVFAVWGMWPRKKLRSGPHNNWQQRDGTEIFSNETHADDTTVPPVDVALGTGGTGVF